MKFKKGDLVWFAQPTVGLDTQRWEHHHIPAIIYQVYPDGHYTLSPTSLSFPEELFTARDANEPTSCWKCQADPFGYPRNLIKSCPHCNRDIPAEALAPGEDRQSQQLDSTCWECWGELHCQVCGADV